MDRNTLLRGFAEVDRTADPTSWVRILDKNAHHWSALNEQVRLALDVRPGNHILDVGCGTGETARDLGQQVGGAGRVVGIDSSETMITEARARGVGICPPVELYLGNAYALAFPDRAFDRCLAEKLFTHLEFPGRALAEMCRVTRPGGRVVVASSDVETLVVDSPDRALTRRILNHFCDTALVNGWAGRQFLRLLCQAGLTDASVTPITAMVTDLDRGALTFDVREQARRAHAAGVVTATEAARWVAHLEEANRAGAFFSALTFFVVSGRKP
jgi:ubiquinone/menaquinone biosynthesis C-methylase UbiE